MTRARLETRDESDEDATRVGKNVAIGVFAAGVVASSGVATADGDVIPSAGTPPAPTETTVAPPTPSLPQPTENALDAYEAALDSVQWVLAQERANALAPTAPREALAALLETRGAGGSG